LVPSYNLVLVASQVVVTIAVYALFLYDASAKDGTWEGLDDAVYYVKVRVLRRC
jgi:hypothetical protein